ncbi:MAG: Uma2 family endonuclease [Chloroflexi bacterium]|nr:Uma2 family endonuclease [Chloroflexota bacterium]
MQWADVLKDKSLRDLPYKIELDARGRIVMTPASNRHARYQAKISGILAEMLRGGETLTECSIQTLDGVKVADVVWASSEFLKKHRYETPYTQSPEICVEITSPSNSRAEIAEKIALYLSKGAREVWVCDEKGRVTFNDHSGAVKKSKLVARFPTKI